MVVDTVTEIKQKKVDNTVQELPASSVQVEFLMRHTCEKHYQLITMI